ncbi:MAG: hypothetical protein FWE85_02655, partial [Clostridiales bacterium]|nr:hypothetical protein [Clostridiales bacterium]
MKKRKSSLMLMILLLFIFTVLAAGCGESGPPDPGNNCEACGKAVCVCDDPPGDGCEACGKAACVCNETDNTTALGEYKVKGKGTAADPLQITLPRELAEI